MNSAVLLIVFKRPDLTARLLEILGRVKPRRLYVAADAARPGRGEEELCLAARACVARAGWPCEVFTDYSEEHLGSGLRVSSAIDWFFRSETEGIILEDDCVPEESFFGFCEELLERYRDDERVMGISGYHGPAADGGDAPSYWFTKYTNTWGWATWRRAWRHFDINLASLPEWETFKRSARFREYAPDGFERAHWVRHTERCVRESIWDAQWIMTCWMHNGLAIVPAHNLIQNVGFRPDASHTTDDVLGRFRGTVVRPMRWPLTHPDGIAANGDYDDETWRRMYRPFTLSQSVRRKVLLARQFIFG